MAESLSSSSPSARHVDGEMLTMMREAQKHTKMHTTSGLLDVPRLWWDGRECISFLGAHQHKKVEMKKQAPPHHLHQLK